MYCIRIRESTRACDGVFYSQDAMINTYSDIPCVIFIRICVMQIILK